MKCKKELEGLQEAVEAVIKEIKCVCTIDENVNSHSTWKEDE